MRFVLAVAVVAWAICACGHRDAPLPLVRHDAGARDAAAAELAPLQLGERDSSGFDWRKRAGQPAFRLARQAEAREDWPAVAAACKRALAADPGHLEAAWLEAVALAKLGQDGVLAPLELAAAGDFGKWATASLEHPAFAAWLGTPIGAAWRRRVEQDRERYLAELQRATIVTAHGDLYGYDGASWQRLTRSYGAVIGALSAGKRIAYVTRQRGGKLAVGIVDLTTGHSSRPQPIGAPPIEIGYAKTFRVRAGGAWSELGGAKSAAPEGDRLLIERVAPRLVRRAQGVIADWDDHGLASAMRLQSSNRIVSVPSPALIDGNTVVWSPDRAHVAFVAQLDDRCTPQAADSAAFVAEVATGAAHEVARAEHGLAIEWVDDHRVAIAGDAGVTIDGKPLPGADGLVTPRRRTRCTPEPTVEEPPEPEEN